MRPIVLILSIASVFFFGRALGGLGGYLVGIPKPELIVQGLAGGTISALMALLLWKNHLCSKGTDRRKGK